ncbi:MAG: hypothetical protein RSE58_09185 [Clostridia bacterium]
MKKTLSLLAALVLILCPLTSLAEQMQTLPSGLKVNPGVAIADPSYNSMTPEELYELAKAEKGSIVIYSETSKMSKAADKFMAEYPELKVENYTLTPAEIQEKFATEQETGNISADILAVNDAAATIYIEWYPENYVQAYYPDAVVKHIPEQKLADAAPLYEALNIWFYNTKQFPDGAPITNWWDIIELDEANVQKYKIFCKNISADTSYMAFYANLACYSAELEQAYQEKYGKPLEYTYDATIIPVPEKNAAFEFLYRLAQLEVGFIADGDEIVQAVAEATEPALGFATANKLDQRDENQWPLAWVTKMKPYASLSNPKNLYLVSKTDNPAGSRLFMYYLMGGTNADTAALKTFSRLGCWFMRDDYKDTQNELTLNDIDIVPLKSAEVYSTYLDVNDFWIYWSDVFAK